MGQGIRDIDRYDCRGGNAGLHVKAHPQLCQQLIAEWGHQIAEDRNSYQNLMQNGPQFIINLS